MTHAFVYVSDRRGLELTAYSAASLVASQPQPCSIHICCHDFRIEQQGSELLRLQRLLTEAGGRLVLHTIRDEQLEQHDTFGHVTKPTLLKPLAMQKLVADHDAVVYLDNDILVFGDLRIDGIEFSDAPIAAVVDMDLTHTGWVKIFRTSAPRPAGNGLRASSDGIFPGYFNAGFMVINCKGWRTGGFVQQYRAALHRYAEACSDKNECTSPDQWAVNHVFQGRWLPLPVTYNMQASAKFTTFLQSALVRHCCGPRKFLPNALFRNDAKDIRLLSKFRYLLAGKQWDYPPYLYEHLFRFNRARKHSNNLPIRDFLLQLPEGVAAASGSYAGPPR